MGNETYAWRVHLRTELQVKYRRTHFSSQTQIFCSWQFHQALNMRNEVDGYICGLIMLSPNIPDTYISPSKLSRDGFTLQASSAGTGRALSGCSAMATVTTCLGFPDMSFLPPESLSCLERRILRFPGCLIAIPGHSLIGMCMTMCCVAMCTATLRGVGWICCTHAVHKHCESHGP